MSFPKNILTLSILAVASVSVFASEHEQATTLDTIRIKAHPLEQTSKDFAVADTVVDQKRLAQGAVTIGEALSGETGISSNQFGAGTSRPVIRGQDGPRIKILQNSSENIDVYTLSPDHAVTVDPALAKQVEVIRGPSTLLFGAGTVGGLVNVTDSKLPTAMPEKGYEGNVGLRYNTGSDEKLATAGVTLGLGDQVALRVEGLKREANDYIAPDYVHEGEKERRVDNTFAKGQTVNVVSVCHGFMIVALRVFLIATVRINMACQDVALNMKAVIYMDSACTVANMTMMKMSMTTMITIMHMKQVPGLT